MTGGKEGTNENQAMSNPFGKLRGPDIGQEGSEVDDLEAAIIGYQGKSIAPVSVEDLPVTKSSPRVVEEQLEPLQHHCIGHSNPDQVQCGYTDESSPPKKNNCIIGMFEDTFHPGDREGQSVLKVRPRLEVSRMNMVRLVIFDLLTMRMFRNVQKCSENSHKI